MGVLSNKIDRKQLKPGDHIYSWRQAYLYAHHGIYVGEGIVIHFTNGRMQQNGTPTIFDSLFTSLDTSIDTNITCLRCGDSRERNTDGVISSCLDCFLSGGELYLFEYGVSKIHFLARVRGGTCTLASSDPAEEVLFRAFYLLKNGFGGYHVSKNNCEDFAIYCKTSLLSTTNISVAGGSGQPATCKAAFESIASLSLRFVTSKMTLVSCGTYCYKRLASDIGFRNGVTKVTLHNTSMMGVFSNKIDIKQLKPGDHIYSWRQAYLYAHHGIYVGDEKVIHFTRRTDGTQTLLDRFFTSSLPNFNTEIPCPKCGDGDRTRTNGVTLSCLDCFLSGCELCLFEYAVSCAHFLAQARGGTCTIASSDATEGVLHRAFYLLENGFGPYNVFKNNCEDFAIYCKTGLLVTTKISLGGSGQAGSCSAAASSIASLSVRFVTTSFCGMTLIGCGTYCIRRLVSDIWFRHKVLKDAKNVPVETIHEIAKENK